MAKRKVHRSRHHIFPRSRIEEMRIKDGNGQWNVIEIDAHKHNLYHQLFENMTPLEIIDYLMESFWKQTLNPPDIKQGDYKF